MHKEYIDITCVFSMYEGRTLVCVAWGGVVHRQFVQYIAFMSFVFLNVP